MKQGARKLPTHHLSIRVPWHDNGWNGSVCNRPGANTSCRVLQSIAASKDDAAEEEVAGKSFENLKKDKLPPCLGERASFMAPFSITQDKTHPYQKSTPDFYGHFRPTPFTFQAFSAACVPFRWMLSKHVEEYVESYRLDFREEREPDLPFTSAWIQERDNQMVMLDTFFGAVKPGESLCFFYAKDTPLSSDSRRVIIGVGKVKSVSEAQEYKYEDPDHDDLRCAIWERNVSHSIRPGFEEGFIFPYAEVLDIATEQGIDPEIFLAFAPDEAFEAFSYASELVSHDLAIGAIISCVAALERIAEVHEGPWNKVRNWLDGELNCLWELRGPFPSFSSALATLLGEGGNLVAYELGATAADSSEGTDPWDEFEHLISKQTPATGIAAELVSDGIRRTWKGMSKERKDLLKLLSRFSLSTEQLSRFFDPDHRPSDVTDHQLLENPYVLFEEDRESPDAIPVQVIDRGILPSPKILASHPLPEASRMTDRVDHRRVRALTISILETASLEGHTLLPRAWLTERIQELELDTPCPVGMDVIEGMSELLEPLVMRAEMADGSRAFQLDRFTKIRRLVGNTVKKRVGSKSKRHDLELDWRSIVDGELPEPADEGDGGAEEKARIEKTAALKELAQSRLSVLIGAAGTGKTTLLKMLCGIPEVDAAGILLLAPTGKARVQLEKKTGREGKGMTLAQLLMRYGSRYNPETGAYRATKDSNRCSDYKTVIIDECSMLTEEQLAAVLDGVSGVDRLVLVGDPRQLPPIGSGRPFVDIVRQLAPEDIETREVKVDRGYAELTIPRRQQGKARADLILAGWFGGLLDPAADSIWADLASGSLPEIRFESWSDEEDLKDLLLTTLVEELELESLEDETGFEESIGGSLYEERCYFHRSRESDASLHVEDWQVISPIRSGLQGVDGLNKLIQSTFRRSWLEQASKHYEKPYFRKLNKPLGHQGIIYGDKVINLINSGSRKPWPKKEGGYVANGDIGLVVGYYKGRKKNLFKQLEVEFISQPSFAYAYKHWEFGEKGDPLDLAYALTVHKGRGKFKSSQIAFNSLRSNGDKPFFKSRFSN